MMSEWFDDLSIPMDIESGLVVITVSGQWFSTSVSGQHLVVSSGAIATVITDVSGQTVKLESGTTVQLPITQIVKISGDTVSITSGQIVQLPTTQVVKVSGETVFVKGSGEWFEVHVLSGGEPVGTVTTDISGQTVVVASGVTGTFVIRPSTSVKTGAVTRVTANSGGAVLPTVSVLGVTVKSLDGDVYVGGVVDMPYSGYGFVMGVGEAWGGDVNNFNAVRLCAPHSGDRVTYIGVV